MKWFRLAFVSMSNKHVESDLIKRFARSIDPSADPVKLYRASIYQSPTGVLSRFKHYFSLPIDEIKKYRFGTQTPLEVLEHFEDIEEKFKNSIGNQNVKLNGSETIVLDLGDGWVWMNLNKSGCSQEARAMGHCGNGDGTFGQSRVLSLRKHVKDDIYRPSLTFILNPYGILGEMKGRGNGKPSPKYHDYVVALLKLPMIKGIEAGGYLPENDFSINDLGVDRAAEMLLNYPHLKLKTGNRLKIERRPEMGAFHIVLYNSVGTWLQTVTRQYANAADHHADFMFSKVSHGENQGIAWLGTNDELKFQDLDTNEMPSREVRDRVRSQIVILPEDA